MKLHRESKRETFIPLDHDPGQRIEADFGEIQVDFPDGRRKVNVLILVWSYSNAFSLRSRSDHGLLWRIRVRARLRERHEKVRDCFADAADGSNSGRNVAGV